METATETLRSYMDIEDHYDHALAAEPGLGAIETMVETLCALAPSQRSGTVLRLVRLGVDPEAADASVDQVRTAVCT